MPASPAPRGELPRALTRSRAPRPRPPQGAISHNEVLELYKKHVDPDYTWQNFTLEEQDKILAAKRSNNELDCSKLVNALPDLEIPEIHVAVDRCCARMKKNLDAQGWKPTPRGS